VKKILVAGLGNVLMGDDGIGPFVIKRMESHYDFAENVELADLGTPGFDLPVYLSSADAVILVDSAKLDAVAGSIRLFRKSDVFRDPPRTRLDPHSPALKESLFFVEQTGQMPADFLLVGVQGSRFKLGTGLSVSVRETVPQVIDAVLRELHRLNAPVYAAEHPRRACIWWDSSSINSNSETI
jgi:hydrogenase maturation protease